MKSLITKYILFLSVTITLISCDEDYLDVNTDPNNPTSVSPELALPVAQVYTANSIYSNRFTNNLGNLFMYSHSQSYGFSWYTEEFQYLVNASFYEQLWTYHYRSVLNQYNTLDYEIEGNTSNNNFRAISKIMKAFHFQVLVDLYGDIPYSSALQRGNNITPTFDDAKTVYESLIKDLSDGIALIDSSADNPGDQDIMFGGDMTKWKQFANTVKMRILIRQSGMANRETYIQEQFDAIAAEGSGFITADASINPGYKKEEGKQNPLWQAFGEEVSGTVTLNNDATCASDFVLDFLTASSDPRIDYLFEEPDAGHKGTPQGVTVGEDFNADNVSNIGPGILKGPDQDAIIISAAESHFLQSEAALHGFISGGESVAKAHYDAGISASFATLGATQGDYSGDNDWESLSSKQEAIITQKWIALMGTNGIETWFEYNRTGFPSGVPVSAEGDSSDRPVRLLYPNAEITANTENVPTQKNAFSDKIFWAN